MKREIYLFFAITFMVLIFYLSVTPVVKVAGKGVTAGFLPHLITYFLLSVLIYKSTRSFKLAIFLAGTYGFFIEAVQYTLPYRQFDFLDILINYVGASFILIIKFVNFISKNTLKI